MTAIFGFLARDVVAGTGMAILSGTWLSIGLVTLTAAPGSTSDALGLLLILAASAMLVPAAAATGKLVAAAVLTTTALRFLVTALYQLTGSGAWKTTAGVVGLALCALAIYAALAMALEESHRRTVLPLLRRKTGAAAITADLGARSGTSSTRPACGRSSNGTARSCANAATSAILHLYWQLPCSGRPAIYTVATG